MEKIAATNGAARVGPPPTVPKNEPVHYQSSPESKIALFRSLFCGRDDVYPRRFESRKTGKCRLSTRVCQRVGRGSLREAESQMCRHARTAASFPSPTK